MIMKYRTTLDRNAIPSRTKATYVLSAGPSSTVDHITLPIEESERAYVSHLWAQDWNSPEDAAYDSM